MSKRQDCVSHSTTEAEIVSTDLAFKALGFLRMSLWEQITDTSTMTHVHEDNEAMLDIICPTPMENVYSSSTK